MPQKAISISKDEELIWNVERLWQLAEGLPVEKIPLAEFEYVFDGKIVFDSDGITFREFVERVKAVNEVDLSHPIIMATEGWIMDGRTRLQKALLLGHRDIAAIRFPQMPEPDERRPKKLP